MSYLIFSSPTQGHLLTLQYATWGFLPLRSLLWPLSGPCWTPCRHLQVSFPHPDTKPLKVKDWVWFSHPKHLGQCLPHSRGCMIVYRTNDISSKWEPSREQQPASGSIAVFPVFPRLLPEIFAEVGGCSQGLLYASVCRRDCLPVSHLLTSSVLSMPQHFFQLQSR